MQIIQSKLLNSSPKLISGFSTKKEGNIAFHVNDNEPKVINSHTLLAKQLHYEISSLVHMKQIHSNIVHKVTDSDNFENPPTCDALITDKKSIPLMVMVADCSPILFFDPIQEVIAVAHVGRAGAFNNIVKNVVDNFVNSYNSKAQDIKVSIGANIKKCCYEVGEEIYKEAKELGLEYSIYKRGDSYYLDVSSIINRQLLDMNITSENIEFINECTCCSQKHFSYRRENITGREAGLIMMKES